MPWISNLRNKPYEQKIRIIWVTLIICALLLIILWIFTSKISANLPKDTTLFQTVGRGIKDIREQYRK